MKQNEIGVILNISLIIAEPNPVNNAIASSRNTTSVTLSWDKPLDSKPEYTYKVTLSGHLPIMITGTEFVTVAQLNPGTGYTFSVFTLAADNTSADPVYVSSTTVPSKPGAIAVMALSNISISLSLGRPVDMGDTQYNFSIIYGSASSSDVSFNEITNSTKIQDLQSGTNYTISVTTVVQGGVKSEAVVLNQFTKPNPVNNAIASSRNTTSVTLSWDKPLDSKPEYTYKVTLSGHLPIMITGNEFVTVAQLTPGTGYTFSVFTLAADNTSADPVNVSSTTGKDTNCFNRSFSLTKVDCLICSKSYNHVFK
ncbi:receptor-type tyrosine-protein phosphatase eta-like [Amblyraja radiata]|uniref:receptor-type tyrosine-protein phosphatase eta-like n=1 Tax=Amblyraja radiata TaxID=386614 RepID=UPI0014040143|nr:receptor-type tyrosine-protein phosphatase eta-like [Amblyraja radiata]